MDPLELNKDAATATNELTNLSKTELIEMLKKLIDQDVDSVKGEVDLIKQSFYKKLKAEHEEARKLFVEAGGDETQFSPEKDEAEEELKQLLNDFKTKKAAVQAKMEAEKDQNLLEKKHILERMKVLVESSDDVSGHINEFRELQKKWKAIGQVPQSAVSELWKNYSAYQESFWDLIKINNELREYDFKKNLEIKTHLCDLAEKLNEESDVVSAFHQLQKYHEEWHETGPVARELRDEIWNRFKEASSVINKKHQAHFDGIRGLEDGNLEAKTAICEKIEALDLKEFKTYKSWDEATQTMIAWQDEWRTIGFAPRKMNHKIFERYRAACDAFFEAKAEFYKLAKNTLSENYDKKKALCVKAEELKDSTDWKETGEKMVLLQKEWKTVGPVAKKYSDELWKRFIAACDYFFEQKNKNTSSLKSEEQQNLQKKKDLIAEIDALQIVENNNAEVLTQLRDKISVWNTIGHVPFKEKDKIYKEYRAAVDKKFEALNIDAGKQRLENFKSNLSDMSAKGENKLYREREKLVRQYEHLRSEIATYENNIGFFSNSSKKGGGLIKEMERKIEALKEEAKLIEQKIQLIDEKI